MSKGNRLSVHGHGQIPHPRSTHVTGTAFKKEKEESLKPPTTNIDSSSPTADYLSLLDDEVEKDAHRPTEDLFGGNDESLSVALAPLQPTLSNRSSGSRFGVSPQSTQTQARAPPPTLPKPQSTPNKPLGAAQRATLPDMSAQRPTTNFNSANWSPLQSMKKTTPPETDSSDEEMVPESAEATFRRPVSPVKSDSRPPHPPSPGIANRVAAYQQQATTGPSTSPPKPGYGTWSGRGSARMTRPQSMFDTSRSNSPGKLSPPLVSVRSGSPSSIGSGRNTPVGHGRRSSINDIVSRYEALSTSPKEGFPSANGNGRASRPPVIASKPPGLGQRKPSGPRVPRAAPPTQPKPASLREASGTSAESERPKEPKAEENQGQENAPPLGRAISKPEIASKPPAFKPKRAETLPAAQGSPGSSRSNSPEKQQPVNLLIQRWNKGELKHR
jgi:AP2-associated kinase